MALIYSILVNLHFFFYRNMDMLGFVVLAQILVGVLPKCKYMPLWNEKKKKKGSETQLASKGLEEAFGLECFEIHPCWFIKL